MIPRLLCVRMRCCPAWPDVRATDVVADHPEHSRPPSRGSRGSDDALGARGERGTVRGRLAWLPHWRSTPLSSSLPRPPSPFAVVICTRNRYAHLRDTLDALDAQTVRDFPIVVVDQSDEVHPELQARANRDARITVLRDGRRGLSRARNLAVEHVRTEWLIFLDDDCHPERDWAQAMGAALDEELDVGFVSGHVGELNLSLIHI